MDISKLDKNFKVETKIQKDDIVFYNVEQKPFEIYGVEFSDGMYRRMPEEVAKTVSEGVLALSKHTTGGRVRFITDSDYVAINMKSSGFGKMDHFAITGSCGFDLYQKIDGRQCYVGTFRPPFDVKDGYESVLNLEGSGLREVTINFPLYSHVTELNIGLGEKAKVLAPKPYTVSKPVVFYGSSITHGGCASRPGMAYEAIISRALDVDFINLGFSGNAKGEQEIADYIKKLNMSVFVYDYDHNAPTYEHYEATHEKMFLTIRQANPDLPIIMMSRPKYRLTDGEKSRIEVMKKTYDNAKARGDNNVYMLDGPELMAIALDEGTVDNCHPTDLGFYSMAQAVTPVLRKILFD